jgi:hypothetical protein
MGSADPGARPRGYLVDRCPRCYALMPRATPAQHAALQMVLIDIALQLKWPPGSKGKLRGPSFWWQLIIAAYDRMKKLECELVPAIDGIGFDGRGFDFVRGERRRRQLNNVEIGEIIEYTNAWAVEHGVTRRQQKAAA